MNLSKSKTSRNMFILRALLFFVLGTFAMAIPISQTNDTIAMPNIYQRGFGSPSHASSSSSSPPSHPPSKFDASGYWVPFRFTYEVVEDVIYIIRDPTKDDRWYAYPLNPTGTNLKKSAKEMAQERPGKQWEMILDNQEFVDQVSALPQFENITSYMRWTLNSICGRKWFSPFSFRNIPITGCQSTPQLGRSALQTPWWNGRKMWFLMIRKSSPSCWNS